MMPEVKCILCGEIFSELYSNTENEIDMFDGSNPFEQAIDEADLFDKALQDFGWVAALDGFVCPECISKQDKD